MCSLYVCHHRAAGMLGDSVQLHSRSQPTCLSAFPLPSNLLSSHTTYPCPTHSLYRPHIHPYLSHLISLELSSYSAVPSAVKAQIGHQFLPICRCKRTLSHWESELQSWTSRKGCISVALGDIKMTMKYNECKFPLPGSIPFNLSHDIGCEHLLSTSGEHILSTGSLQFPTAIEGSPQQKWMTMNFKWWQIMTNMMTNVWSSYSLSWRC